jgi:hypothetical protein
MSTTGQTTFVIEIRAAVEASGPDYALLFVAIKLLADFAQGDETPLPPGVRYLEVVI